MINKSFTYTSSKAKFEAASYTQDIGAFFSIIITWLKQEKVGVIAGSFGLAWELALTFLMLILPAWNLNMPGVLRDILDPGSVNVISFVICGFGSAGALIYAGRCWKGKPGSLAWTLCGLGLFFISIGMVDLAYEYFSYYKQHHITFIQYGSLIDIFWGLGFITIFIGLFSIPTARKSPVSGLIRSKIVMDTLLFLCTALSLCWYFVFLPIYGHQLKIDHSLVVAHVISILVYPLVCIGLTFVMCIIMMRIDRSTHFMPTLYCFLIGLFLASLDEAISGLYTFYITNGQIVEASHLADWPDILFNAAFMLAMTGGFMLGDRAHRYAAEQEPSESLHLPARIHEHLTLLYALTPSAVALIGGTIIMIAASQGNQGIVQAFIVLGLLTTMVAIRQGLTIIENQRLYVNELRSVRELEATQTSLKEALKSEQHYANDARREAESALQAQVVNSAVLDATKDGILLLSSDQEILLANESFATLFGLEREQILHQLLGSSTIFKAVQRALGNASELYNHIDTILKEGRETTIESLVVTSPRNLEITVYSAPVGTHDGKGHIGQLFVFKDMTHEREVERLKSEMVSLTSHELRAPLASITGFLDLFLEEGNLTEEQQDYISTARNSSKRLSDLVATLLDLTSIEAGKIKLTLEDIHIQPLVHEVCASLQANAMSKNIEVKVRLSEKPIYVQADRQRMYQILTNLLSNALKYTPNDGKIVIRAIQEGDSVRFEVKDTGIGLTEVDRQKLFTKFYRADNSLTRTERGTGLGLALTKSLVELHNGKIWVESQPQKGSTFFFTLHAA